MSLMRARVLLALAWCSVAVGAAAQPGALPQAGGWMLGVGAQTDENESDSSLAMFNLGVGRSTWLSFAAGRSTSPADRADVVANTLSLGLDQRFDGVGFTVAAERWGDAGVLETTELGGSLYFERERWRIAVGYDARDIDIPFSFTGPLGNTIERTASVSADAVSLDARVSLGESWRLYLHAAEHDYARDLSLLPRIDRLNLLSSSTLTLAGSFLDNERSIGFERELDRVLVSLTATSDASAIDGSKFETLEAAVLFPVGARVDLEVNLGDGRSEFFGSGLYGGLLVLVYGR
jgi:hypothetical protein